MVADFDLEPVLKAYTPPSLLRTGSGAGFGNGAAYHLNPHVRCKMNGVAYTPLLDHIVMLSCCSLNRPISRLPRTCPGPTSTYRSSISQITYRYVRPSLSVCIRNFLLTLASLPNVSNSLASSANPSQPMYFEVQVGAMNTSIPTTSPVISSTLKVSTPSSDFEWQWQREHRQLKQTGTHNAATCSGGLNSLFSFASVPQLPNRCSMSLCRSLNPSQVASLPF
ncbi:hypothetical protein V8E52_004085 [Russula decolorans]